MGLQVSVELPGWTKLGYDACYYKESGYPWLLSTAKLRAYASQPWEKSGVNAVARGYALGVRQFAMMHDARDSIFALTWLVDATKGVEFVKQELASRFALPAATLAIIQCVRDSPVEPWKAHDVARYCIDVPECTDADLLESPRFLVVLKSGVGCQDALSNKRESVRLWVTNCVDRYGSFTLMCSPDEGVKAKQLKVEKLRGIRDATFCVQTDTLYDYLSPSPHRYSREVVVSGTFEEPNLALSPTTLCRIGNYTAALCSSSRQFIV